MIGVEVNDGRKQWRADGGAFGPPPYRRTGDPSVSVDEEGQGTFVPIQHDIETVEFGWYFRMLAAGTYQITVSFDGYESRTETVKVSSGYFSKSTQDFDLRKEGSEGGADGDGTEAAWSNHDNDQLEDFLYHVKVND